MFLHVALGEVRHLGVQRRQDLVAQLDERHVEAAMHQVLGRLQPDEAAADDHRPGLGPHGLEAGVAVHPGQEHRTLLDPLADRPGVGHGAHLEDAGQVDAGQWRADRRRAGRQHQLVVGLGGDLAGLDIAQVHGLLVRRNLDRLAVHPAIDLELVAEGGFGRHQQARFLLDHAAYVIGQPAVRVRHVRPALDHDDLGLLVQSTQTRRARRSTGDAPDDDDFHDVSFFSNGLSRTSEPALQSRYCMHQPWLTMKDWPVIALNTLR